MITFVFTQLKCSKKSCKTLHSARQIHFLQQPQQQRGSETKKRVCVCICVCVMCLRTQAAGNIKLCPSLHSHWLRCCQAHLIQNIRYCLANQQKGRISLACHTVLSVVTSHGPLNGKPQSKFKWPDENGWTYKNKQKKNSVWLTWVCLQTFWAYDNDTLWLVQPRCLWKFYIFRRCVFQLKRLIKIQYFIEMWNEGERPSITAMVQCHPVCCVKYYLCTWTYSVLLLDFPDLHLPTCVNDFKIILNK